MSKFLKGTLILIVASLITRILGFINRIVMARFIGEEGVGLYMMALPTLFLVVNITQLGLPVAISKFVAEANARGDERKDKKNPCCFYCLHIDFIADIYTSMLLLAPMLSEYYLRTSEQFGRYSPLHQSFPLSLFHPSFAGISKASKI